MNIVAFFLSSAFVLLNSGFIFAESPKIESKKIESKRAESLKLETPHKVKEFHICSNKKIIRTIRIDVLDDKTCQTNYTKAGVDKVVGSGAHYESCVRILGNVKNNLEGAGWSCRKVNSVTMTSSN